MYDLFKSVTGWSRSVQPSKKALKLQLSTLIYSSFLKLKSKACTRTQTMMKKSLWARIYFTSPSSNIHFTIHLDWKAPAIIKTVGLIGSLCTLHFSIQNTNFWKKNDTEKQCNRNSNYFQVYLLFQLIVIVTGGEWSFDKIGGYVGIKMCV